MSQRSRDSHAGIPFDKLNAQGELIHWSECYVCGEEYPTSKMKDEDICFADHKRMCFNHFLEEDLEVRMRQMDSTKRNKMKESFVKNDDRLTRRKENIEKELEGADRVQEVLKKVELDEQMNRLRLDSSNRSAPAQLTFIPSAFPPQQGTPIVPYLHGYQWYPTPGSQYRGPRSPMY